MDDLMYDRLIEAGSKLTERIKELEAELKAERFRTKVLEEKIEKMRGKADGQVSP